MPISFRKAAAPLLFATLLWAGLWSAPASAQNLLANPGFEESLGGKPAEWFTFSTPNNEVGYYSIATGDVIFPGPNTFTAYEGTLGTGFYANPPSPGEYEAQLYQILPAVPGQEFRFRGRAFVDSGNPVADANTSLRLRMTFFDSGFGTLGEVSSDRIDIGSPLDQWILLEAVGQVPPGTVQVQFSIVLLTCEGQDASCFGTGTFFLDDMSAEDLSAVDTDGDGLVDVLEDALGTDPGSSDSDVDGIDDFVETDGGSPVDTDADGVIDALDTDSDDDGLLDSNEGVGDPDTDGIPNYRDSDSDDDGFPDGEEDFAGSDPYQASSTPTYAPSVSSVVDVAGDQGGAVRLNWSRSAYDAPNPYTTITGYGVYRRIESGGAKLEGWDSVGWIAAHGDAVYNFVSPTACDSTAAGACWSVFFVRATTADPFLFYDSAPDSGYSVDNLAPSIPGGAALVAGLLTWSDPADPDFRYFTVYGSGTGVRDGSETIIGQTIGTDYDVSAEGFAFYLVTATDFAGNESAAAVVAGGASDVPDGPRNQTALLGNAPNPFNPQTWIRFTLAERMSVRLAVLDISGRRVRNLAAGIRPAGPNVVRWNGRDDAGRECASGTYFYRLEAGGYAATKRMLLVK
jgi:hypothetical protein